MTPVSYYAPDELTSPKFAFGFAKGCGGSMTPEDPDVTLKRGLFPGSVALFGSPSRWPILRKAQAERREWFYGDHGYFGRGSYFRITRNAYQHDGTGEGNPDRWAIFNKPILPWRTRGSHILVCPNSPIHFALHGLDHDAWLQDVRDTLRLHTDRPLRVRWKKNQRTYIQFDLADCWACVVFSSAAALDALIYGVPVFVTAPFAAAYRMGLSDLSKIEAPIYPDGREPFIWALASQQWTLPEMVRGVAWRTLQEEDTPRAA